MSNNPFVSVLMGVNRDDGGLDKTINSVLSQSYPHFEFIIVNDGANNDVTHTVEQFQDQRIRLFNIDKSGLTKALNFGLKAANGNYIARQDAGDISLKDRLMTQINFLSNNPELKLVGTWVAEYSESGDYLGDIEFPTSHDAILTHLPVQNVFCHGSTIFNIDILESLSGYRMQFKKAQDIDLWLRVVERYKAGNIDNVLYHRIVNKRSITIQSKKQQYQYAEIAKKCYYARISGIEEPLYLLNDLKDQKSPNRLSKNIINSNYYLYCGRICFSKRNMNKSRSYLLKSIFYNPSKIISIIYYFFSFLPNSILNNVEKYWKTIQRNYKLKM